MSELHVSPILRCDKCGGMSADYEIRLFGCEQDTGYSDETVVCSDCGEERRRGPRRLALSRETAAEEHASWLCEMTLSFFRFPERVQIGRIRYVDA